MYRLASAKFANLSGVGAAAAPGRWNRLGQKAIYTSAEKSLTLLERLAHEPKDEIPSNLALMKIRVSGKWEGNRDVPFLDPRTGGCFWFYRTLAEAKNALNRGTHFTPHDSFAVAVPSVIVPVWNVVLYPQGIGFWDHVSLESVEPFEFDPRLFPENASAKVRE